MAVVEGKEEADVRKAYDLAIASAGRIGFCNDQAYANERAGSYFARLGGQVGSYWAPHYLKNAYSLYNEWEAHAKTAQLQALYPEYCSRR